MIFFYIFVINQGGLKMKTKLLLAAAVAMFITVHSMAQTSNAKMQSVFIYNFTKMISWPAAYQSGDFVVGVIGSSPIIAELQNMAATKKAGSQTIVIQKYGSAGAVGKCHILFIPASQMGNLGAAIGKCSGNSTLIITEADGGIAGGAAINFVVVDNKQKFELKESNATKKGLQIGSDLKNLAIIK